MAKKLVFSAPRPQLQRVLVMENHCCPRVCTWNRVSLLFSETKKKERKKDQQTQKVRLCNRSAGGNMEIT